MGRRPRRRGGLVRGREPGAARRIGASRDHGFDDLACQFPWTVAAFLDRRGDWQNYAATQRVALTAAGNLGDRAAQARAHRHIGRALFALSAFDEAHAHLSEARDLFERLGEHVTEAGVQLDLSRLRAKQGQSRDALDHAKRALDKFQAAGIELGQAFALNMVGWVHASLGDPEALAYCAQSLRMSRKIGDRRGQAFAWDSLGFAHHRLGQHLRAITCFRRAIQLYHEMEDPYEQSQTLVHLGDAEHATGDLAAARQAWLRALSLLEELDHPEAAQVRARLAPGSSEPASRT